MAGRVNRDARHRVQECVQETTECPGRVRKPRDKGASSIELVILAPLVILSILLIGQFLMWYQARHVAIAAAQYGARYARDTQANWQATAQTQGLRYAQQLGGSLLDNDAVTPVTHGSNRGVTVTATVPRIIPIPGLTFQVKETSEGPIECFRVAGNTQQCAGD
jgi:TadE-like protein